MTTKRTTEYRALRRTGLVACRRYRKLLAQATRLYGRCQERGDLPNARYWRAAAADWFRRLGVEQSLLAALRRQGPAGWRLAVLEMPASNVEALLEEMGVQLP